MENKKFWFDGKYDEFVINGNRLSRESLLNLVGVGLFANIRHVAIASGKFDPTDGNFAIALTPDDFESWLLASEREEAGVVFSYSEQNNMYYITVNFNNDRKIDKDDEVDET